MLNRKRVPLDQLDPRRICIIKPSALGDIVHALPVLTGLRRRFPRAAITWAVNRAYEPLIAGHPDLNETLPFDRGSLKRGWWAGLQAFRHFLRELRQRHFDLVLDLQGLLRSGVMTWTTGAKRRLGLQSAREGASLFYTDVVEQTGREDAHAADRYWRAAAALGAKETDRAARFPAFEPEQAWAAQMLAELPRPWIIAAVGARWLTKRWPTAYFGELLKRAQDAFGGMVLFVGGPEDTAASIEAARHLSRPLILTGSTTLPQLAALLSRADVMAANDTGPLHLACALGRPVVAPYTCTKAAWTGPFGQMDRAVETRVWCAGSLLKRCPRLECMAELTPDRLWPILREVLQQWEQTRRSA
jgi:lipopolysaccharide heptosyltransferase I